MVRKNELNSTRVALSLGLVFGIVYLACALLFAVIPREMKLATSNLFHGFNITAIESRNVMSFGSVLFGLVEVVIFGLFVGWLFALIYNALPEKRK